MVKAEIAWHGTNEINFKQGFDPQTKIYDKTRVKNAEFDYLDMVIEIQHAASWASLAIQSFDRDEIENHLILALFGSRRTDSSMEVDLIMKATWDHDRYKFEEVPIDSILA